MLLKRTPPTLRKAVIGPRDKLTSIMPVYAGRSAVDETTNTETVQDCGQTELAHPVKDDSIRWAGR